MRMAVGILVVLTALAEVCAAQIPRGNVSVGYSFLSSGSLPGGPVLSGPLLTSHDFSNFNGLNVSGELKLVPWISGVGEYGVNFGTERATTACLIIPPCAGPFHGDTRLQTFLFGPRASFSIGRLRPFAHVLLGGAHLTESFSVPVSSGFLSSQGTVFAAAFGGGLDYKLIKGIAWRIQADDLRTEFFNTCQHNARFTTGIVFRF